MFQSHWTSYSIYIDSSYWFKFMNECLSDFLIGNHKSKGNKNFYINLNTDRGENIIVFLEYKVSSEAYLKFEQTILQYIDLCIPSSNNNFPPNNGNGLFSDIDLNTICLNYVKMKADPFIYFTGNNRKVYYDTLRIVSSYLIKLDQRGFDSIIENKFLFCFNLISTSLRNSPFGIERCIGILETLLKEELADTQLKIGKDISVSIHNSYLKNFEILKYNYQTIHEDLTTSSTVLIDRKCQLLIAEIRSTLYKIESFANDDELKVFIKSLLLDIYEIFNLKQSTTCSYFIKNILQEFH